MNVSISNIAWNRDDDEAMASLLRSAGLSMIDVAPSKYFDDFANAAPQAITSVKEWWRSRGIRIIGMQSLLFGTQGLNVFGDASVQQRMLSHLKHVFRIAEGLGADRLVFGSPKNRDRTGLSTVQANEVAAAFFRHAGDAASSHGVTLCLEPNPGRYGANFMTTTAETAQVVEMVAHPSIRMQLDTGAVAINEEAPTELLPRYSHLIGHVHLSEPDLLPLGSTGTDHAVMAALIDRHLPKHPVAIEMLPPAEGLPAIKSSIGFAVRCYGTTSCRNRTP
ncbi:sugar phosphate isomerase/epimerase family protein [Stenotrophomonas maltophilia]|nr:sugar phosphate isomerase/epimerase [Stenotrophomonas maltophilia]